MTIIMTILILFTVYFHDNDFTFKKKDYLSNRISYYNILTFAFYIMLALIEYSNWVASMAIIHVILSIIKLYEGIS